MGDESGYRSTVARTKLWELDESQRLPARLATKKLATASAYPRDAELRGGVAARLYWWRGAWQACAVTVFVHMSTIHPSSAINYRLQHNMPPYSTYSVPIQYMQHPLFVRLSLPQLSVHQTTTAASPP